MNSTVLCKPATAILAISLAGILYHFLFGSARVMIWWIFVGILGTGVFQGLCWGGLEPLSWILMLLPVLVVCFFFAVALFSSSVRITNAHVRDCDRCGRPKHDCYCVEQPEPQQNECATNMELF